MTGAVLLTYRPLGERDAAAQIGARLAARFGKRSVVYVSHLRPERFAASRAVVALLARGDNTPEFSRWLADLRVAIQVGVPVALVLLDGAAQPPAQLWPNDPAVSNAAVVPLSTADFDRGVDRLLAILTPLVGANLADRIAEPSPLIDVGAMSIEEPSEATSAVRGAGETAASDLSGEAPGTGLRDADLREMLDNAPPEFGLNDVELESLAHNKFAPRPAPPASAAALASASALFPPRSIPLASAPAAEPPRPASERSPTPALQAGPWTTPLRPLAAARMPDSAPWPTAIRQADRAFATAPLGASGVAESQPRPAPDRRPTKASRSRGWAWLAALGLAVVVVVAAASLAYAFRGDIAALIDPIANNLFHRPPPAS